MRPTWSWSATRSTRSSDLPQRSVGDGRAGANCARRCFAPRLVKAARQRRLDSRRPNTAVLSASGAASLWRRRGLSFFAWPDRGITVTGGLGHRQDLLHPQCAPGPPFCPNAIDLLPTVALPTFTPQVPIPPMCRTSPCRFKI